MENKSAVSILLEYCFKNQMGPVNFIFYKADEGGQICKVTLCDMESQGNGRSKRDAKHMAAQKMMNKVKNLNGSGDESIVPKNDEFQNKDFVNELRNYCVQHDKPLPTVENVQQCGFECSPTYIACCTLASIKRYVSSCNKKNARQRAAAEMLSIIATDMDDLRVQNMQHDLINMGVSSPKNFVDVEAQRRSKYVSFYKMKVAGIEDNAAPRLCERHDYFKNLHSHLKEAAFKILNNEEVSQPKDKALAILAALKLTPRFTEVDSTGTEPLLLMELVDCSYDCVLMGLESNIYSQIINYFREMLD